MVLRAHVFFPGWDLYYTDPARHLIIKAGEDPDDLDHLDPDDLDHDLSDGWNFFQRHRSQPGSRRILLRGLYTQPRKMEAFRKY